MVKKAKAKTIRSLITNNKKGLATVNLDKELNERLKKYKNEMELRSAGDAIRHLLDNSY